MAGTGPVVERPLRVEFTLTPVSSARAELARLREVKCLPGSPAQGGGPRHEGPGNMTDNQGRLFLPRPGAWVWDDLPGLEGRFRLRMELRLSERSAEAEDLKDAYTIELNGRELAFEWGRKNVWNTGNAYFAHALTVPVSLTGGPHVLRVRSRHTWCAAGRRVTLVPVNFGRNGPP